MLCSRQEIEGDKNPPDENMGRVENRDRLLGVALGLRFRLGSLKNLRFGLGFRQADWALTFFPLTALLEEFDPLETFKNRTLSTSSAGDFERCVFGHNSLVLKG